MKKEQSAPVFVRIFRGFRRIALLGLVSAGVSCTNTYDAYGRPVQSVDPGAAVAGAAAVGILGYAIGQNRNNDDHNDRRNNQHYRSNNRRGNSGHYYR